MRLRLSRSPNYPLGEAEGLSKRRGGGGAEIGQEGRGNKSQTHQYSIRHGERKSTAATAQIPPCDLIINISVSVIVL